MKTIESFHIMRTVSKMHDVVVKLEGSNSPGCSESSIKTEQRWVSNEGGNRTYHCST